MKTRPAGDLVIVVSVALALVCSWITPALAQAPPGDFASVVSAARAWPGCLGVETGQTSSGKRVIFAWFESKKALIGWYHSEVHQKAMKTVFPNLAAEVVEARAGLGADTPDRTPIVGPLPGYPDVYVSVPSTNGFLLSAVMADMLTALLVRGEQHPLLPRVLPERAMQQTFE